MKNLVKRKTIEFSYLGWQRCRILTKLHKQNRCQSMQTFPGEIWKDVAAVMSVWEGAVSCSSENLLSTTYNIEYHETRIWKTTLYFTLDDHLRSWTNSHHFMGDKSHCTRPYDGDGRHAILIVDTTDPCWPRRRPLLGSANSVSARPRSSGRHGIRVWECNQEARGPRTVGGTALDVEYFYQKYFYSHTWCSSRTSNKTSKGG